MGAWPMRDGPDMSCEGPGRLGVWSSSSDESSLVRGITDLGADSAAVLPRGLSISDVPRSGWAWSWVGVAAVVFERPAEEPSFIDFIAGRRLTCMYVCMYVCM